MMTARTRLEPTSIGKGTLQRLGLALSSRMGKGQIKHHVACRRAMFSTNGSLIEHQEIARKMAVDTLATRFALAASGG